MKQAYLDTVILKVIENTGNDPLLKENFVRRILTDRLRESVPSIFFPVSVKKVQVTDGQLFLEDPFLSVVAVEKPEKADEVSALYLMDEKFYDLGNLSVQDYVTEDVIYRYGRTLGCYHFTEDLMTGIISVYADVNEVAVFYYTPYADAKGRVVVPKFAEGYLEHYGTMRATEVLLNQSIRGRTPVQVPQLRYTLNEIRAKVTREYKSMQSEIHLLCEKVIIKPVNHNRDAVI
jgi:hypothetical protein